MAQKRMVTFIATMRKGKELKKTKIQALHSHSAWGKARKLAEPKGYTVVTVRRPSRYG